MCGVQLSACARGSSHDNPMGVSHRFRGIGSDCCYFDPADEDTGIHGVSQTYRVASQPRLPRRIYDYLSARVCREAIVRAENQNVHWLPLILIIFSQI